jgi:hypothetical protein
VPGAKDWFPGERVVFKKMGDFKHLSPTRAWVLVDEHPDSINDGALFTETREPRWVDLPASYHNRACGFALLTGIRRLSAGWWGARRCRFVTWIGPRLDLTPAMIPETSAGSRSARPKPQIHSVPGCFMESSGRSMRSNWALSLKLVKSARAWGNLPLMADVFDSPLEPPDSHHLSAAEGWLELSNPQEAQAELERIIPEQRGHPAVLSMRWQVYAAANKWEDAFQIALTLIKRVPDQPEGWIWRAYAARRIQGGSVQAAWDALVPAAGKFPKVSIIPFNLACYACQMGKMVEAMDWLRKAIAIGDSKKVKRMALDEKDLAPLWKEIGSLEP